MQLGSNRCIQSLYSHSTLNSGYVSLISSFDMILISSELNPGVSAIKDVLYLNNSTCLVVWTPLPSALLISLVSIFKSLLSLFSKVLLPEPDWPVKTTISFFISFVNLVKCLFVKAVIP